MMTFTVIDREAFDTAKSELKASLSLTEDQAAEAAAIALHLIPGDVAEDGITREQAGGPPDDPIPDEEEHNG